MQWVFFCFSFMKQPHPPPLKLLNPPAWRSERWSQRQSGTNPNPKCKGGNSRNCILFVKCQSGIHGNKNYRNCLCQKNNFNTYTKTSFLKTPMRNRMNFVIVLWISKNIKMLMTLVFSINFSIRKKIRDSKSGSIFSW